MALLAQVGSQLLDGADEFAAPAPTAGDNILPADSVRPETLPIA